MIFVDSFFDESGTHEGSAFVVVAGFADFSERWLPFSIEWGKALAKEPAIEYFHSTEANSRLNGEFNGWDKPARDDKVISLIDVIKDAKPQPLISAVKPSDYNALLLEFPDSMPEDPYVFCAYNLFIECYDLGQAIRKNMPNEQVRVSLNFENNQQMEAKTRFAYQTALEEYPSLADCTGSDNFIPA